jgi:phosphatidylglycerophosphate synthase
MNRRELTQLLDRLAGILIRCFFFSWGLLVVWFLFYVLFGDFGYGTHAQWFAVSRHDYALVNYYGMAFVKICAISFFLFPYFAIKLVLRKGR